MPVEKISVGILAPSADTRELLRNQVEETGQAVVHVESKEYCPTAGDAPTRRFVDAEPGIIVVDMHDPEAAIQTVSVLHAALPETWLFVASETNDPQLIIDTMRAGAREFLAKPVGHRNFSQAFARYAAETHRQRETKAPGKIYCVVSAKGGAGATSVAINLATSLATIPQLRIALLDLNSPVGDAAAYLSLKPQFTVADALAASSRLDPVLLETLMCHSQGVAVLPGLKDFRPWQLPEIDALGRMLRVVAQTYTHTFIDLPSLDREHLQVVAGLSAAIIIVLTPELPALWRADRLLRFLATIGATDKLRLVMNRHSNKSEINDREVQKILNHSIYWKLPNNYNISIRAINSGKALVSLNHSGLAASYLKMARDLAAISSPEKRRGVFGLFS